MKLDHSLFQHRRSLTLMIALLSFVVAGCVSHEAGARRLEAGGFTRQASLLLTEARHTQNTGTRIGLTLAAADKASQGIVEGSAPEARTLYNAACVELAVLLKKSSSPPTLPTTFATPAGSCVLKFVNARAGRWEPDYFTKLLKPAELKNKAFVSRQPPAGYGGVVVGVHRPTDPRAMLLPWVGVSAPVTAVLNFSKPAKSDQPAEATLTLYDPATHSTARIAGKDRPLAADLNAPFGYYRSPAFLGILAMLRSEK